MNAQAAEALFAAERNGVRQIKGDYEDNQGGRCAMGVLFEAGHIFGISEAPVNACGLCGDTTYLITHPDGESTRESINSEACLVVHFNDEHDLTFSEIARKLGPDSA